MINLPTLVRFQGQVPDRATMNREEFAIATYYYLRYINDDFVPSFEEKSEAIETQLNQFSDDMNALKSDTETIKNDTEAIKQQTETIKNDTLVIKQQTESIKNDTQTIKDDTQTLHDETQSFRDTAGQYKDLAKNYANADQNVEVEQGYYSAKHWAMVAQNLANDTEAILPEGSINDNAVASTTTWSSQKLDSYLAKSDISNVAASAILEKVKSVDGAGSGLDADLLDGHEGSYYTNASNISSGTLSADRLPTTINSNTTGNAATATKLKTARTIALSGDVSGSASFDGSGNITITTTVQNNASHNHDDRYYTKSQSDGRYLGKTAKAADSDKLDGHDSSYFATASHDHDSRYLGKTAKAVDSDKLDGYDSTQFDRLHHTASANVGGGWITVASTGSGRWYGEIYVMDTDSGDHAFIHLTWMRSYQDSNVSVINVGGHSRRITGVRVLYDTDDNTHGTKYLQIYVTTQSTYEVRIYGKQLRSGWNVPNVVTPVVQNSISGYAIYEEEIHQLENVTIGAQRGFASAGNFYFTGTRSSTNRAHGIVWTAFDKESSGDFSDVGKIIQTTNTQGLSGSVLLIEQLNDSNDGVAIHTASNTEFKHNGYTVWTSGNDGAGSGLDADKLDGKHASEIEKIIKSSNAPSDTSKLWWDTNTNEIKMYLEGKWRVAVEKPPTTAVSTFDIFEDGSAVALWQFDGNANDTGGVYNGTLIGDLAFTSGRFGQGLTCTSPDTTPNSDYMDIPIDVFNDNNVFTISFWFKANTISSSYSTAILSNYNCNSSQKYFRINITTNSELKITYWDRSITSTPQNIIFNVATNNWYFVVFIVDKVNHNFKLYINGNFVGEVSNSAIVNDLTETPRFFGWVSNCSGSENVISLDGVIDQVRIFNRALTEDEIQTLYEEEA